MKNNKGFTLIELLAVVVIMGILVGVAVPSVYKYVTKTTKQSYDTMARSAKEAAESSLLNKPKNSGYFELEDLMETQELEKLIDPKDNSRVCKGKAYYELVPGDASTLDEYKFTVKLCCINYEYEYKFNYDNNAKTDISSTSFCNDY